MGAVGRVSGNEVQHLRNLGIANARWIRVVLPDLGSFKPKEDFEYVVRNVIEWITLRMTLLEKSLSGVSGLINGHGVVCHISYYASGK